MAPPFEFWRDDDEDLQLLRDLLEASFAGRYRFWTERQESRSRWRPWRVTRKVATISEWHTTRGPERVTAYNWLQSGYPESGEPLPYTGA